ncbi:amidotransferase [Acetobacterium paludosum]|uniref:Amidotransferase n=1 Tax=Acetobacterium paludosum TaxID=52693 RepID=A0A923HYB3_9FIRM|nr:type 1 glutamine amidotransferase [Acetobacterium paludosum]MBC3886828.1 amidotransferase [Acetobacterium paludosum]
MRIHYLQHVPFENPGRILEWAEKNKGIVTATHLYNDEKLPDVSEFDWLVVMGGPMNIYEDQKYPWLAREKHLIKEAIAMEKVVIGLCLGSQLIADVIGGKVVKNKAKEIGWFPIAFTAEARKSPLFSFFPDHPVVFHWHGDTFADLPQEAVIIAESKACQNQGFVYKMRVFGFQFHLENTSLIIEALIENCGDEMTKGSYVQLPEEVRSQEKYMLQDNQWMDQFLDQVKRQVEEGSI